MERYWYLEHITTGRKIILQNGENVLGRHSEYNFCPTEYLYLSRQHATLIVNIDSVILMPMNALNGVYINGIKMNENGDAHRLRVGDRIELGSNINEVTNVMPIDYAIFVLRHHSTKDDVVIISSDKDEEEENIAKKNRDTTSNENGAINLPNFLEVKQEWLTKESTFDKPTKNISKQSKPTKSSKVPSQEINTICKNGKSKVLRIESSDSEEEVPMSNPASGIGKLLRIESSDSEEEVPISNPPSGIAFQRRCAVRLKSVDVPQYQSSFHEKPVDRNSGDRDKASTSHQQSKAISKRFQPCEDKSQPIKSSKISIQETNSICTNRKSKVMRIRSSDSEEEVPFSNSANGLADKSTPKKAELRRCSERLKSVYALKYQCNSGKKLSAGNSVAQYTASILNKQTITISKRSDSERRAPIFNTALGLADKSTLKKTEPRRCSERLKTVYSLKYQCNSDKKLPAGNSVAQYTEPCDDNSTPTKTSNVLDQEIYSLCKKKEVHEK